MFFDNPFEKIIKEAKAQENSAIISPTLPVDPNIGSSDVTGTPTPSTTPTTNIVSAALLAGTQETINQGDTLSVSVNIASNSLTISSFKLYILYDPNKLSISDSEYLDTYFTNNSGISINQSQGEIIVEGTAQSDARTLNRTIANIDFVVESTGNINIAISERDPQSFVNDSNNTNILTSTSDIDFLVGTSVTTTPSTSPIPTITTEFEELPKNNFEDYNQYLPVAGGVIVLLAGIWMVRLKRHKDDLF